jgi:hypothetical protein
MTSSSTDCLNKNNTSPACGCGSKPALQSTVPALPPIDRRGDFMCRLSNRFRMKYAIAPGLYAIGSPTDASPVLVTANYRLTLNRVSESMEKSNVWVLVLDTKGINVWCAAGKGTFGTKELINRITCTGLSTFVKHRNIILPQLGAPGVAAHEVTKATGFHVVYGPIYARDIPAFIEAGSIATAAMRVVGFSLWDRLVLTPMEFFPYFRKYLLVILGIALFMGLKPTGILFYPAVFHTLPLFIVGTVSVIIGAILVPILLPWIPFRSFAIKGALMGIVLIGPTFFVSERLYQESAFLATGFIIFIITVVSYIALNFTGCTPFTNISGVKKEMRIAVPAYLTACGLSGTCLVLFKLREWGLL